MSCTISCACSSSCHLHVIYSAAENRFPRAFSTTTGRSTSDHRRFAVLFRNYRLRGLQSEFLREKIFNFMKKLNKISLNFRKNIRRLEWCVLQAPIVRSIIIFLDVVAVAEMREDATPYIRYSDMASLCSLLLAIFGVHTLARVTSVIFLIFSTKNNNFSSRTSSPPTASCQCSGSWIYRCSSSPHNSR